MTADESRKADLKREIRNLRKALRELTNANKEYLSWWDTFIQSPLGQSSSVERGRAIAKANGALDFATDAALRFGLGLDSRGKKLKR